MKRILALFISLLLALSSCPALAQNTAETTAVETTTDDTAAVTTLDYLSGLFTVEDTLYAFTWSGLYRFDENDQNPVLVPSAAELWDFSRMTAYGDTLFAVSHEGTVSSFALSEAGLEQPKTIGNLPLPQGDEIFSRCIGLVADDEAVWALVSIDSTGAYFQESTLYRVDRASGEVVQVEVTSLTDLCAYKDGFLLARQSADQTHAAEDYQPKLVSIDKSSLTATTLCTLSDRNLFAPAYDAENDLIYMATAAALYRLDITFQMEKCALLSLPYTSEGAAALLRNDRYLVACGEETLGFTASETDPALLPTHTLKIGSGYMDDMTRGFCKAHPEIAVEMVEGFYSANTVAKTMVTASSEIDVYLIYLGHGSFAPIRDKGYYAVLSQSDILTDTVSRMYPLFSAHCYDNQGQLFALPYRVQVMGMGYSPSVLKEMGLTEEDLPSTYIELLDFLVGWVEMNGDDSGDKPLFEMVYDIRQQLYRLMETAYIGSYLQRDEPLAYDTPLFRSLLEALDKATPVLEDLNQPEANLGGYTITYSEGSAPSLFTMSHIMNPSEYPFGDYLPLLLTLDENTAPVLECTQQVLMINPYSENIENALLFLEYMAQNIHPYQCIALYPDQNEPIERESYQDEYNDYSQQLADLQKRLEAADDAHKQQIQEQIDNLQPWMEDLKEWRWAISAEQIETYRQLVPLAVMNTENFSSSSMISLSGRYLQGEMSVDEYTKELERLLRMMRLEDE